MSLSPMLLAYRQLRMGGVSRYQAAKHAGYSRGMCLRASRLDDAVTVALPEILEKEGIDNFAAAMQMKAGLLAERAVITEKKTYLNGKIASVEPVVTWVPDHFIRHKYLDTYLEVTGQKKKIGSSDGAEAPANLPQLIIGTLNIALENRKIVEVVK